MWEAETLSRSQATYILTGGIYVSMQFMIGLWARVHDGPAQEYIEVLFIIVKAADDQLRLGHGPEQQGVEQ